MKYPSGESVELGDKVELAGRPGRVLAIIEEGQFGPTIPREEWSYLKRGAMLEVETLGLLWQETTADDEDLKLISRGEIH